MSGLFSLKSRITLLICCLVFSLTLVGLILTIETRSQNKSLTGGNDKNSLVSKVENYPASQLRILENSNTPLRLLEAKSKEISAAEFTRLTGAATTLSSISSFPEATVQNTSDKTINMFMLIVRDPAARSMRSQVFKGLSIRPGESFSVTSERFITPEKVTYTDNKGVAVTAEKSPLESVNNWIQFAERSNFFVTVGMVVFEDGTRWTLTEEGEIK